MMDLERIDEAIEGARKCWNIDAITVSKLIEAARAYRDILANGQRVWWCVPFHEFGNMAEPCLAGSGHDKPYECRWRLLSVYPKEAENE